MTVAHHPATPRVARITVARRTDRALADDPRPAVSWVTETSARDWRQERAEIRLDGGEVVAIEGDRSTFVPWPFAPIRPHARHRIEVRVTGRDGVSTTWSDPVEVQAAFLADGEWRAPLVALAHPPGDAAPALLRSEFVVQGRVAAATLYATAHGVYQVQVNGSDVDDAVLKPGWTSYQHRLTHEATDVTGLVRAGQNAIGVRLAGGWWTERYGFAGSAHRVYGDQPAAALQLHLRFDDGSEQIVVTGEHWRGTADGPLRSSGIYAGETIDAGRALPGWSRPGFDDAGWEPVELVASAIDPEPSIAEPVRRTEELPVRQVLTTPDGKTVLDFGQNLVGRLRVKATGPAGSRIVLRHAEVLEDGEIATRPLREAAATDELILSGAADVFEPEFTFHGFRYAEVTGWPGELDPEAITAIVIGSDMRRTGWFSSSDELLNRLHENAVWGMRGNFVSVPTDCPQRDERMGWTGDLQVFAPTAAYLYDSHAFLASWLRDVAAEQAANDGICPVIVPQVLDWGHVPAAAWGDAATVVPTVLYERFGDLAGLRRQYPSMRAWADALLRIARDRHLWEGRFQFGDWLDPDAPAEAPGRAKTDPDIVAGAYLFRSLSLVARAARILGDDADAGRYGSEAEQVRRAWVAEYTTAAGRIVSDSQTAYALAIAFEIVDESARASMGRRLVQLVRRGGYRIGTGFVGTSLIQDALVATGHVETARRLLFQTQLPSWLYPVTMGATTVWERWDSMLPDGSINPGEMTSFNHYAFGCIADWLHRTVAGLAPDAPGYRRLRIRPIPLTGLEWARAAHETPYGLATVSWAESPDGITVSATVPPNTTALVELPGREAFVVGSGTHEWSFPDARSASMLRPLSLDSSLADVIDDEHAHTSLLAAISAVAPAAADELRHSTEWVDTRTVRDELLHASPEVASTIRTVFADLNTRLPR